MTIKKIILTKHGNVGFNHIICESCIEKNYKLGDLFINEDNVILELMKIEYVPNKLIALYYLYDKECKGYKNLREYDISLHSINKEKFYKLEKIVDEKLVNTLKKLSPWC